MKPRKKKCKACGKKFQPWNTLQKSCSSLECALEVGRQERERQQKRETRDWKAETRRRKEALMESSQRDRRSALKSAQNAVNAYVNWRDRGRPCISCDAPDPLQPRSRNASHFRSVGSCPSLRFNLWNINSSCMKCNLHLSGNISEYKPRLQSRIGADKVEWIESQNHAPKYSLEYIRRIGRVFRKKLEHKRQHAMDAL